MSKGFGAVQRRIIAAYEKHPEACFSIEELAGLVYPGTPISPSQRESVRRALKGLAGTLPLRTYRSGGRHRRGWRLSFGLA